MQVLKEKHVNFILSKLTHFGRIITLSLFLLSYSFTHAQKEVDPMLEFAKQQVAQEAYYAAISTLDSYLSYNKNDTSALYWKAHCFYKLKNFIAAEDNYRTLLKISPRNFAGNVDMANMYILQKKYKDALPYYNTALSINGIDASIVNSRGMCYYYNEKFELAIKDFKQVIKLDPTNYKAYNNLGSATYNNQNIADASVIDLKSAEELFNKALELKPDFELALRNRGIVRYYLDNLNVAYDDLLRAIQLDPKDENAYYYIGKVFYKQKNYPLSLQFYDNAISLYSSPKFLLDRGICKLDMDDTKSARSDFYKSFQSGDFKGVAAYQLARTYAAEGDKQNAFAYLRDAKKYGLFVDTRYFNTLAKDKYFIGWEKDKEFIELVQELKFGRR
ncbi:MAG: tetratricopeptide repeat protein [Chitinophagales bacterium]